MLKKLIRQFEKMGWKKVGQDPLDQMIEEEEREQQQQQYIQPQQPTYEVEPQEQQPQQQQQQQQSFQQYDRPDVAQWLWENVYGNTPMPQEWINENGEIDPEVMATMSQVLNQIPEQHPGQLDKWQRNVLMRPLFEDTDSEGNVSEEERQQMQQASPLMQSFNEHQQEFLNKNKKRLESKYGEDVSDNAILNFQQYYLGGPSDPEKFQDERLNLLTNPNIRGEIEQYAPDFSARLSSFLNDPQNQEQIREIASLPEDWPVDENILDKIDSLPQKQRRKLINEGLAPLLEESSPGTADSLLDALNQIVSGDEMPENLKNHWNSALKRTAQKYMQEADPNISIHEQTGDEGEEFGDILSEEDKERASEAGEDFKETEIEAAFNKMQEELGGRLDEANEFGNHVSRAFYAYYNPEYNEDITSGGSKSWYDKATTNLGTKDDPKQVAVGDLINAYMPSAKNNLTRLIDPSERRDMSDKQKQKALQEMQGGKGKREVSFGRAGSGRLKVEGEGSLADMGLDVSKLVGAQSISPYIQQLGEVKQRVHRLVQEMGNNDPQAIAERIQQEYGDDLEIDVNPEFVSFTLKEGPGKGQMLQEMSQDRNSLRKIQSALQDQWPKLFPFIFDIVGQEEYNKDDVQAFTNLIGIHRGHYYPIEEGEDVSMSEEALEEGKRFWEASLEEMKNAMYPLPEGITEENAKEMAPDIAKKRNSLERKLTKVRNNPETIRQIYENLLNKEIPNELENYLQWREQNRKRKPRGRKELPEDFREQYLKRRQAAMFMYMIKSAFDYYVDRITRLSAIRRNLQKTASTHEIDTMIHKTRREGFDRLMELSEIL